MTAIFVLLIPAAIMVVWKRWLFKNDFALKAVIAEFIGGIVLINCLVIAIAFEFFESQGNFIEKISTYPGYALKYFLLALALSVVIPWVCRMLQRAFDTDQAVWPAPAGGAYDRSGTAAGKGLQNQKDRTAAWKGAGDKNEGKGSNPVCLYICAALIPVLILLGVMIYLGIAPFGDNSVFYWDARLQHKDYYGYIWDILHGEASIDYSFGKSFGGRMIGIIGFYVSSPLNFLLLFFKKSQIALFMSCEIILRIGLCGLTSQIFIRKRFNLTLFPALLLSTAYALMEYNVYYCRNVMWLDGVILLPLIALGVYQLITEKKKLLLYVSAAVAIIANWYTGYMVCLMSVVYFIYEFCIYTGFHPFKSLRREGRGILRYIVTMLLSVITSLCVLLPVLLSLAGARGSSLQTTLTGTIHFDIIHFFSGFSIDALVNDQTAPVIFCGGFILLSVVYYFFNSKISRRERLLTGAFVLFFIGSFCLQDLELLWTAFRQSGSYYFRFSFVFSFFMLVIASRAWASVKKTKIQKKALAYAWGFLLCIFYVLWRGEDLVSSGKEVFLYVVFLGILAAAIAFSVHRKKSFQRIAVLCVSVMLVAELAYNTNLAFSEYGYSESQFSEYTEKMESVVAELEERSSDSFFRFEKNVNYLTVSDGSTVASGESLLHGYNSIEHYSSAYDLTTDLFLGQIGYSDATDSSLFPCETYWNSSMILTDSLLSIRYSVQEEETYGWEEIDLDADLPFEGMSVYENTYSLPLGYNVASTMSDVSFGEDPYENQSLLLSAMLGEDTDVYQSVEVTSISSDGNNEVITLQTVGDGPVYLYLDASSVHGYQALFSDNCEVYVNGEFLQKCCCRYVINSMLLGDYSAGETIEIRIQHNSEDTGEHDFYVAQLDEGAFEQAVAVLDSGYESNLVTDGNVLSGTYTTESDATVFLSVPYEDAWTIYVDGEEVEARELAHTFIGLDLSAGEHEIYMVYHTPGLRKGAIASVIGVVAFILFAFLDRRKKRRTVRRSKVSGQENSLTGTEGVGTNEEGGSC